MGNYTLKYTGEEVDELLTKVEEGGGSGVSSWNDLTDRPFGEEIVTRDAITWDGNTDGLDNVMGIMYRVSGVVPTLEDMQDGGTIKIFTPDGEMSVEFTGDQVMDAESVEMGTNLIMINTDATAMFIATSDNATMIEGEGIITFPKAGVYLPCMNGMYISSFAINGYTFTETEVETIDIKYLPESHQFGENTTYGDTLTWDGDMTGKPVVSLDMGDDGVMNFCKVSSAVPTLEDINNGIIATVSALGTQEVPAEQIMTGDGYIYANALAIISEPNTTIQEVGLTFSETGIWLIQQFAEGMSVYVSEVTIPNYSGFEMMGVKPINSKYLPEPLQFGEGVVYRDKLTWDGDTTGLDMVTMMEGYMYMYRVSDSVPTLLELSAGFTSVNNKGQVFNGGAEDIQIMGEVYMVSGVFFAPRDGISAEGNMIPKKGTYFIQNRLDSDAPLNWTAEFSINNFKFLTTGIKTIDMKYLPVDDIIDFVKESFPTWEGGSY